MNRGFDKAWALFGRLYVLALSGLLALTVSSLCSELKSGEFERHIRTGGLRHLDFVRFYSMGKLVSTRDRFQVYDPRTQLDWVNAVTAPASHEHVLYMEYPPWAFLPLVAFASARLDAAYVTWSLLSLLCACASVLVLIKASEEKPRVRAAAVMMLAVCGSYFAFNCLVAGQMAMFMLLLIAGFFAALISRRDIIAGICLAITSIKLQYLPFLLIPPLVLRRRRLVVSYAVAQLVLVVIAACWFGWDNIVRYPACLLSSETHVGLVYNAVNSMINLRGLLAPYVSKQESAWFGLGTMIVGLALTWLVWRRAAAAMRDADPEASAAALLRWAIALTPLLALVFCPHSYLYDTLLLAVSAMVTVPAAGFARLSSLPGLAWRLWAFALALYPVVSWLLPVQQVGTYFLSFLLMNVALLGVGLYSWACEHPSGH